jgi:putative Mg2+ transporter-C (MgtC) family protein
VAVTISQLAIRLLAATAVGAAVGLDRELRRKAAGFRTHALVALGASLLTLIVLNTGPVAVEHVDALARVIQGIIAGVGFLGGGAILKTSGGTEQESVHGITTAASIWVVAALGIACGAGQWESALLAAAMTLIVLVLGGRVDRVIKRRFGRSNGAP